MKAEISKHFSRNMLGDDPVDKQLNEFLKQHKNYSTKMISFSVEPGKCVEHLFVVFTVDCSIK